MDYEKMLDEELKHNKELRKVFEEHPERRAMYIAKLKDAEGASCGRGTSNPAYCQTCIFRHGKPPFGDLPDKIHCAIFTHENGTSKPHDVYFEGAECEYYEKD